MNKLNLIPTAEEFFNKKSDELKSDREDIPKWMIEASVEFAKLHVEEAQEAWFNKIKSEGLVTQDGIAYLKNAYSLENIK